MPRRPDPQDSDDPSPEQLEQERKDMAEQAANPRTRHLFERLLRLAADKGDVEQTAERISWGIDVNAQSKRGRTPLFRNVCGVCPMAEVVDALLRAGADATITDDRGRTPLDVVRRRLLKYEGRPRRPVRQSPSILPTGDLRLDPAEHQMLDEVRASNPEWADDFELGYLKERRKAAERVFDKRGELEKILPLLEAATKRT